MALEVRVLDDEGLDEWVAERRAVGDVVGVMDGRMALDERRFHAAIATALALPEHYGRSWDSLDEVLAAFERSHVLVIRDARWLLDDEPPERLRILSEVLGVASSPEPDPFDRSGRPPAPPLEVVLLARSDEDADILRKRFEAVGADLG